MSFSALAILVEQSVASVDESSIARNAELDPVVLDEQLQRMKKTRSLKPAEKSFFFQNHIFLLFSVFIIFDRNKTSSLQFVLCSKSALQAALSSRTFGQNQKFVKNVAEEYFEIYFSKFLLFYLVEIKKKDRIFQHSNDYFTNS